MNALNQALVRAFSKKSNHTQPLLREGEVNHPEPATVQDAFATQRLIVMGEQNYYLPVTIADTSMADMGPHLAIEHLSEAKRTGRSSHSQQPVEARPAVPNQHVGQPAALSTQGRPATQPPGGETGTAATTAADRHAAQVLDAIAAETAKASKLLSIPKMTPATPPAPTAPPVPEPQPDVAPDPNQAAAPVWEVDRFLWPEICQQLQPFVVEQLGGAGGGLLAAIREGMNVVGISAVQSEAGRSTISLCLARAAAAAGARVAIVDGDVTHPCLAGMLGVEVPCNWTDTVRQQLPIAEAAVYSIEDQVTLVPLRDETVGGESQLAKTGMSELLGQLSAQFDLVVVDLPVVGRINDSALAAMPIDAVLLVRDARRDSLALTRQLGQSLVDSGIGAVAIADNFDAAS